MTTTTRPRRRRRTARFTAPPIELVTPEPVRAAIETITRLAGEERTLRDRVNELRRDERAADEEDLAREAEWIKGGRSGSAPTGGSAAKVRDATAASEREREAIAIARSDTTRDLAGLLAEHAGPWLATLLTDEAELRATMLNDLAAIEKTADALADLRGTIAWLRNWHGAGRGDADGNPAVIRSYKARPVVLTDRRGGRVPFREVVEGLRTLLASEDTATAEADDGVHVVGNDATEG